MKELYEIKEKFITMTPEAKKLWLDFAISCGFSRAEADKAFVENEKKPTYKITINDKSIAKQVLEEMKCSLYTTPLPRGAYASEGVMLERQSGKIFTVGIEYIMSKGSLIVIAHDKDNLHMIESLIMIMNQENDNGIIKGLV